MPDTEISGSSKIAYNQITTFPLTIASPPTGTGYYQQLINIPNPMSYGINSQSSNFQFALPNGTLLFTWIQSFNATSLTMWVKMPYGTSQVELQVLPSFENVLSATGYVGKSNSTSSNYYLVFQNMSISEQQSQGNTVISWMNTPDNGQTDTLPDGTTGYREVLTTDASITRPQYSFYKIPFAGSIQVSGWELIPSSNAFYVVSPTETPSLPVNKPGAYVIAGTQGYTGSYFQLYSNQTLLNSQAYAPSTWQYFTFTYYQNNGSGIFTEGNDPGSIVKSYSFSTSFTNESYIGIGEWGGTGASNYYHTKIAYWGAGSMPSISIGTGSVSQLAYNQTSYSYTVYIATITYENPAIIRNNVTGVSYMVSNVSWVSVSTSGKISINPPAYLTFSKINGNYGSYNATLKATGKTSDGVILNTLTYIDITVIIFPQTVPINVTKVTHSIFPQITPIEIIYISIILLSVVVTVGIMVLTADRQRKKTEEEKYEKDYLKDD